MPLVISGGQAGADPGPAPPSRQRTIINDVHTDVLDVRFEGGELKLQTRAGNEPFEFLPASDVLFQLKDIDGLSRFSIPDDPLFGFLGPVGAPTWIAPQDSIPGLIYPGWDTEGLLPGTLAGNAVDIRLLSVSGPGAVEVFILGNASGDVVRVFSSQDPAHHVLHQAVSTHTHANWAFSALGRYTLTFEVTGADPSGRPLSTGPVSYTWFVGGTQASDVVVESTSATLAASPPSSEVGQAVTLTGSVNPGNAPGWIEFRDGDAVLGHAAVSGGQASITTNALAGGTHQLTARFVPANSTDFQPSTSAPLTYQVSGTGTPTTTSTTTTTTTTTTTGTTTSTTSTSAPGNTTTTTTTSCVPTTTTQAAAAGNAVVLNAGHVDFAARLNGGALSAQIKDGTVAGTTTWREPSRVVFHVLPAAAITVPAGFDFVGRAGSRVWLIPQAQDHNILWLGWNTEEIPDTQAPSGVTWSLDRVEGPGTLVVYLINTFRPPTVVFNSGDGVPDRFTIPLPTHAHGNWAFTREGIYRVTFTYSATLASGAQVRDTEVLTFAVGAANPNAVLPANAAAAQNNNNGCAGGVNASRRLAFTGATLAGPLALGGLLVLVGVLVLVIVRRRRASAVDGG